MSSRKGPSAGTALEKLLSLCSPAYARGNPTQVAALIKDRSSKGLSQELVDLLTHRNGCYAFESALHIFGVGSDDPEIDIVVWNDESTWRNYYGDILAGYTFFAEEAFGGQFAIRQGQISFIDPETGEAKIVGNSIEEWARAVLVDFEFVTGFPYCHAWQVENRPLEPGERLMPKYPFVLGGQYELDNFWASNAVTGMQYRGYIASQIRDLPDGAQVNLEFVKKS